jgi:hypothetical protein
MEPTERAALRLDNDAAHRRHCAHLEGERVLHMMRKRIATTVIYRAARQAARHALRAEACASGAAALRGQR